jgi:hypothetical protein
MRLCSEQAMITNHAAQDFRHRYGEHSEYFEHYSYSAMICDLRALNAVGSAATESSYLLLTAKGANHRCALARNRHASLGQ